MKYLKQIVIIMGISFIGEGLKYALPLPIPASIYGMALMLLLLMTGIIKYESVKEVGRFLVDIMPVMFIPAGVGLITSWDVLKGMLIPTLVITVVTLFMVILVTGRVSQAIIRKSRNVDGEKESTHHE